MNHFVSPYQFLQIQPGFILSRYGPKTNTGTATETIIEQWWAGKILFIWVLWIDRFWKKWNSHKYI